MSAQVKRWLPIALCCLPGAITTAIVVIGLLVGGAAFGASFSGRLGFGLIALAILACPLSIGRMMWRGSKQRITSGNSQLMADCCLPSERSVASEADTAAGRLAALRERREALERELAELEPK